MKDYELKGHSKDLLEDFTTYVFEVTHKRMYAESMKDKINSMIISNRKNQAFHEKANYSGLKYDLSFIGDMERIKNYLIGILKNVDWPESGEFQEMEKLLILARRFQSRIYIVIDSYKKKEKQLDTINRAINAYRLVSEDLGKNPVNDVFVMSALEVIRNDIPGNIVKYLDNERNYE